MRQRFILPALVCGILTVVMLAATVAAQEVPKRRTLIIPPPAAGATPLPAISAATAAVTPTVLDVSIDKARVVTLPGPVRKIVIGNEKVADVHLDPSNPSQVFIVSKSIGSTNVFFMDAQGRIVHQAEVRVTLDREALHAALRQLLPDETIEVSVFRDSVFLTGNVHSAAASADAESIAQRFVAAAVNVTNMLKVAGSQQVILQVRVTEIDRATLKNISVNNTVSFGGRRSVDFTTTSPTLESFASGTIVSRITGGIGPTTFEALERQSLAKTLTAPTLTALSGQTAKFLSGGETPVPTGVDQNGNALIEFREFGIQLEFTPVVVDENRISMRLVSEISAIDTSNTVTVASLSVNGFTTKRTETTVDLPSGGTLMISGLLQDNINDTINGFPFLKDLPVLGALFRSTSFQRDETELVVTVTAYLAKPAGAGAGLASPTDGFEPASDIDIYLLGRLHREYAKGERPFWETSVKGPFGYIMK